jgi:hypothetical protein
MPTVFVSRRVRRLEREVAELKDELWWQWIGNHEEGTDVAVTPVE